MDSEDTVVVFTTIEEQTTFDNFTGSIVGDLMARNYQVSAVTGFQPDCKCINVCTFDVFTLLYTMYICMYVYI